jgi:hypothetical protein
MKELNAVWDKVCAYDFNWMGLFLIAAISAMLFIIWRFHAARDRPDFDVTDLFMHRGRLDKVACAWVGSFLATTWVLIYQTFRGGLTEWLFAAYLTAWVAPIVSYILKGSGFASPPDEKPPGTP